MTRLLQECLYPPLPLQQTMMMTLDAEFDHNSIDPNEANENSSKASIHSTGRHVPVHSMTSEQPQHPLDEEELDDIELPVVETQVPVLH